MNAGRLRGARAGLETLLILGLSFTALLLGMDRSAVGVYDEGDVLYGAQRVLQGGLPYRDFWAIYGPAQYWIVGGLFKLFGSSILVERIWDSLVRAGLATLAYGLARRLDGRRIALAVWPLTLGWLWLVKFYGYPLLPAALLGLGAIATLLVAGGGSLRPARVFAAGVLAGFAGLFRPDIGLYTVVASALVLWISTPPATAGSPARDEAGGTRRTRLVRLAILAAGILAVASPAALFLLANVPLPDLLRTLLIYPAKVYPGSRTLPYPPLFSPLAQMLLGAGVAPSLDRFVRALALYFPWCVAALAALSLWRSRSALRRGGAAPAERIATLALALILLVYGIKSTVRPHLPHVAHLFVPAFVLAGMLLAPSPGKPSRAPRWAAAALLAVMAYAPLYALANVAPATLLGPALATGSGTATADHPPRARWFLLQPDQLAAVAYVRGRTRPTDRIFVGNGRHDLAFGNDVLFYFLAERDSATADHEFNPGVTTTAETQAAIIADLREQEVRYVVRATLFDQIREPNASGESSGVFELDRFLEREYAPVARFGRYEVARRRAGP